MGRQELDNLVRIGRFKVEAASLRDNKTKENTVEHERKRAELLRQIARNKAAEFGDRGDAILELGEMSPEFSEAALLEIARDRDEDEDLVEDAGDALGSMWVKLGQIPIAKIRGIRPPALKLIIGHLKEASECIVHPSFLLMSRSALPT
jgi:hypothetical protein